jgi:copper(I)-binding protein
MFIVWPVRVVTLVLLVFATTQLLADGVRVDDPWVRAAPPTAKVVAGYMTLVNESEISQHVVGAASPGFGMIEMHRTVVADGMARMEEQARLTVEPGAKLSLEPGGYHLMLMMPMSVPKIGDQVEITLELEGGETVDVIAIVRRQ